MSHFETLNNGEWSEVYALLKVIVDKRLDACNHRLDLINNEFCSIISVEKTQQDTGADLTYKIKDEYIEILRDNNFVKKFPLDVFDTMAKYLLESIKSSTQRTYKLPKIKKFLDDLLRPKLKASNKEKKDIEITIEEPLTKTNQTYGFSIKSNLSKASSTLLNASAATNFTYFVNDIVVDKKSKAKELVRKIKFITFDHMDSEIFCNNLQIIDTQFPEIMSLILLYYYQGKARTLDNLIKILQEENPLKLKDINVYRMKIGDFLLSIALGMMPNTAWNRKYDADGGMLVIKENGDIASFYIFKQKLLEELKEYLITKSFLDTPSTTRHKFGHIYTVTKNGKKVNKLKLNLQIRIES